MDNDKIDGEGQVCTEQTNDVESTTLDRNHVATPAAIAPATIDYDVDHDGYNCPPSCPKKNHLPNVKRDEAHMYKGACMRA